MSTNAARSVTKAVTTAATPHAKAPARKDGGRAHSRESADRATASSTPRKLFVASPYPRIARMHTAINQEEKFTAQSMADELGVSTRTIKRDIDLMRDGMNLPIEWDPGEHSYVYTRSCTTLPLLRMDAGEALGLALAGRFFRGALGQLLRGIFQKIEPVLGGAVSVGMDSVDRALSRPQAQDEAEFRHFLPLLEAIRQRTKVRIDYAGAKRVSKNRLVHPLHLAEIDQCWLLFAHDPALGAVRKFLLKRMHKLSRTGDSFELPPDFDARTEVEKSLGRFSGDREYEVRIALDDTAAFYARENPWHLSQQLTDRSDGRVGLTMRVNGLVDAKNLVIRWGEHVEVLAPAELRAEVRKGLEAALRHYRSS